MRSNTETFLCFNKRGLLLCCILFACFIGIAQTGKEKNFTDADEKQMEKGQMLFEEKHYRFAAPIFEKLLAKYPTKLALKYFTGFCYLTHPDKQKEALQYLSEVYDKNKKADEIELGLALANFHNSNFDEAVNFLNLHSAKLKNPTEAQKKEIELLTSNIKYAKEFMASPLNVKIENLGTPVNTKAAETCPVLNEDESLLFFTYRGEKSVGGLMNAIYEPDKTGIYYEDIYYSVKENGKWAEPLAMQKMNTEYNDEALCFSYDEKQLFISRDKSDDDGDIYVSALGKEGWSTPLLLSGDVNSPLLEDNCSLGPDGKTLYFSSTRAGGMGGKDIYKSVLQDDGNWGHAINLGDKINTPLDEDDPFIHFDGRLLIFSSKGHNSMGGYDIFKSYLNPADSTWSEAENMGYPVNSTYDDLHYRLSASGDRGYFEEVKADGFGDRDIYFVEPGITGKMPAVDVVKGKVSLDGTPAAAELIIETTAKNEVYRKVNTDSLTGLYKVTLPAGQDYKLTWKKSGFPDKTELLSSDGNAAYLLKTFEINFESPVVKKDSVVPVTTATATATAGDRDVVEGLIYRVQVSANELNWKITPGKSKQFGTVEEVMVNGKPRYTMDRQFTSFKAASEELEKVRAELAPDAFLIAFYKGKRSYLDDLRKDGIIPPEEKK